METQDAIRTALTIREYDQRKRADFSTILKVIDAGRMAASARNRQPWAFVVVVDPRKLKEISDLAQTGSHIAGASFAIAVVSNPSNRFSEIDCARAAQNMVIQAWDLGLGSSWVGSMDREQIKGLLGIPMEMNLLTVLPFGYPTRGYEGRKSRKPLSENVFLGSYGNPFPEQSTH